MQVKYPKLCPLTAAIVISGFSSFANAQLGQNLAVDIRSLSMGNAVTADPPGISAVHFNPAALSKSYPSTILQHASIQGTLRVPPHARYMMLTPLSSSIDVAEQELSNQGQIQISVLR